MIGWCAGDRYLSAIILTHVQARLRSHVAHLDPSPRPTQAIGGGMATSPFPRSPHPFRWIPHPRCEISIPTHAEQQAQGVPPSPVIRWANTPSRGSIPAQHRRSGEWKRVRRHHLRSYPTCAACGRGSRITVHHVVPVSVDPSRELDPSNLITLCRGWRSEGGCHLKYGHRGSWSSWNPLVIREAAAALQSFRTPRTLAGDQ